MPKTPPLTARNDARQICMFPDDVDCRPELLANISSWIRVACDHDPLRIIAANAMLKAHYHPACERSRCSEVLLARIWRDLPDAFPLHGRAAA